MWFRRPPRQQGLRWFYSAYFSGFMPREDMGLKMEMYISHWKFPPRFFCRMPPLLFIFLHPLTFYLPLSWHFYTFCLICPLFPEILVACRRQISCQFYPGIIHHDSRGMAVGLVNILDVSRCLGCSGLLWMQLSAPIHLLIYIKLCLSYIIMCFLLISTQV